MEFICGIFFWWFCNVYFCVSLFLRYNSLENVYFNSVFFQTERPHGFQQRKGYLSQQGHPEPVPAPQVALQAVPAQQEIPIFSPIPTMVQSGWPDKHQLLQAVSGKKALSTSTSTQSITKPSSPTRLLSLDEIPTSTRSTYSHYTTNVSDASGWKLCCRESNSFRTTYSTGGYKAAQSGTSNCSSWSKATRYIMYHHKQTVGRFSSTAPPCIETLVCTELWCNIESLSRQCQWVQRHLNTHSTTLI